MKIGLMGAHRVGKTTLAQRLADQLKLPFVPVCAGEVFEALGFDPAQPMDFAQRLVVQMLLLNRGVTLWAQYPDGFVTDRTPIDMLAYTLTEVQGHNLTPGEEHELAKYIEACIRLTNQLFHMLVLVQPGIPVISEPGKASLSPGYREHLNTLMLGVAGREDIYLPCYVVPRAALSLDDRVGAVKGAIMHMMTQQDRSRNESYH